MGHLLMIESWVGGTGRLLPAAIAALGHRYTVVTRRRAHYAAPGASHPVFDYAENILTCETNDLDGLTGFLSQQHALLGFDGVITICDYYIDTAAHVARALDLPAPFPSSVAAIRDKGRMRIALERAGLANPSFRLAHSWDAAQRAAREIGYPLVIKPTDLSSSAHVRLVDNEDALRAAYATIDQFTHTFRGQPRERGCLLEHFMAGPEVSVEAVTIGGETTVIGVTDKSITAAPFFIEDGHMFPAALNPADVAAATGLARAALAAVGFDRGISHTEIKLTPDGPRIVEINPRVGGNYIAELVRRASGIDLLAAMIDLALGRQPDLAGAETGVRSAAITFIVPPHGGRIAAVEGLEQLEADPQVARWTLDPVAGTEVAAPIDNACYLGHVVAEDRAGLNARAYAERAAGGVLLRYADQAESAGVV